jgi:hypothetical protein
MDLRNVLSKCHNFPINGQRDAGITTGRQAKKKRSPGPGTMEADRRCDQTLEP